MRPAADLIYDTAMTMDIGRRDRQEDALASDFPSDQAFGFVVLADGMGGHAAGDMASKIVVTEVFSELKLQSGDPKLLEPVLRDVLRASALHANNCLAHYAHAHSDATGLGSTLLAPVLIEDRLYWVSVGDSPLYLFRDDVLTQVNENHAVCSQIDFLVSSGIMRREEALSYPDQSCLTSVLVGGDIAQIDCPAEPLIVKEGDILIAASDGIQFLSEDQISGVLRFRRTSRAEEIAAALIREIRLLDDPCQDNSSLCVIKILRRGIRSVSPDTSEPEARSRSGGMERITIMARIRRRQPTTA